MAKHSDIDLMLYADGELAAEEAQGLSAELAKNEADRAKVKALGQVGEVVRGALELSADDASDRMAGLWSRIESEIGAEESTPARAPKPAAVSQEQGLWASIREFFGGSWGGHLVTGAAAAAVVALVMSRGGSGGEKQTVIRDRTPAPTAAVSDRQAVDLESQPPEVENLEVYDGSGMILTIPGDDEDSSTAVIWISEDHEVEGPI